MTRIAQGTRQIRARCCSAHAYNRLRCFDDGDGSPAGQTGVDDAASATMLRATLEDAEPRSAPTRSRNDDRRITWTTSRSSCRWRRSTDRERALRAMVNAVLPNTRACWMHLPVAAPSWSIMRLVSASDLANRHQRLQHARLRRPPPRGADRRCALLARADRQTTLSWIGGSDVSTDVTTVDLNATRACAPRPGGPAPAALRLVDDHVGAAQESRGDRSSSKAPHQLVAVSAHADTNGKTDAWTRLDGEIYTWITEKVASHGGWSETSLTLQANSATTPRDRCPR